VIRTLLTRGLIEEAGTEPETGAYLYRTTNVFLEKLGLDSLDQLPPLAPFLPDDVSGFDPDAPLEDRVVTAPEPREATDPPDGLQSTDPPDGLQSTDPPDPPEPTEPGVARAVPESREWSGADAEAVSPNGVA
jgi:hypothetical protein